MSLAFITYNYRAAQALPPLGKAGMETPNHAARSIRAALFKVNYLVAFHPTGSQGQTHLQLCLPWGRLSHGQHDLSLFLSLGTTVIANYFLRLISRGTTGHRNVDVQKGHAIKQSGPKMPDHSSFHHTSFIDSNRGYWWSRAKKLCSEKVLCKEGVALLLNKKKGAAAYANSSFSIAFFKTSMETAQA